MCYQSFVIFPYDVIATQMNGWCGWMQKKEKAVFEGGNVIASQVNGWRVGARKGYETKDS